MNNNKDLNEDLLKNEVGKDENYNSQDLNEMMDLAKENNYYETEKKMPVKMLVIIGVAAIVLITALTLSKVIIKPQEFIDETKAPGISTGKDIFLNGEKWNFDYPVKVPKWSKQVFNQISIIEKDEIYRELIDFSKSQQDVLLFSEAMPSEKAGDWKDAPPAYTNKLSEIKKPNGQENELFSYTLKEDYLIAYSSYVHQLINPVFGNWVFAQRYTPAKPLKDNKDLDVLKPLFDPSWWDANIVDGVDYTKLPILVDWNGDDFGGLKFAERIDGQYGTWYGVVDVNQDKVVLAEMLGRDERDSPILKINTPIKYLAFGENEPLEKAGVLELTLASNPVEHMINRVVILDAKLILN